MAVGGGWRCPSCTAPNDPGAERCAACGTRRPAEAGGSPPEPPGPPGPPRPPGGGPPDEPPPGTGPPEPQPPPVPSTAVEVRRIECPSCGAAIDLAAAVRGGQASCPSCGSVIDLSSPELSVIARHVAGGHEPKSAIRVGQECNFFGVPYRVIGRLRYREKNWVTDEWFLAAGDGTIRYLEEDGHHFRLLRPFTPKQPPPKDALERGSSVRIDGQACMVLERGRSTIEWFEGQLPWKVEPGAEVSYVDVRRGKERVSVEWTKREIEFFRGAHLTASQVAIAFGVASLFPMSSASAGFGGGGGGDDEDEDLSTWAAKNPGSALLLLLVILIMFGCSAACDEDGGSHGGRSGWSGGGFGGK